MTERAMVIDHSLFDFGRLARDYDRWYQTPAGKAHDRTQKADVIRLLRPHAPGDRLLDVGCGTGHWSRFFASLGYAVTGVDVSAEMIRVANSRPAPRCAFEPGDACALPFEENSFEVVAAMAVLEFVSDVPLMLDEAFRCVKRRGSVLIGTLNRLAEINRRRLAKAEPPYASARMLAPRELRDLLRRFGRVRMVASGVPPTGRGRPPGGRTARPVARGRRKLAGPFLVAEVGP